MGTRKGDKEGMKRKDTTHLFTKLVLDYLLSRHAPRGCNGLAQGLQGGKQLLTSNISSAGRGRSTQLACTSSG